MFVNWRSLQLSHVRNTDLKATSVSRTRALTPTQLHANKTNATSGQMQMQWKVNCIWLWFLSSTWLHLPLNPSQHTIAIVLTPWRRDCAIEIQLPRIWPSSLPVDGCKKKKRIRSAVSDNYTLTMIWRLDELLRNLQLTAVVAAICQDPRQVWRYGPIVRVVAAVVDDVSGIWIMNFFFLKKAMPSRRP